MRKKIYQTYWPKKSASYIGHRLPWFLNIGIGQRKPISVNLLLSFHSLWLFGVQCHLLVLVHCVFWKPTSLHPFTNKFWSTSCFLQLFKDADFIFHQDLAPAHTSKSTKSWLNDHGVGVLDWPANSPDLNPIENLCSCGSVVENWHNDRGFNSQGTHILTIHV